MIELKVLQDNNFGDVLANHRLCSVDRLKARFAMTSLTFIVDTNRYQSLLLVLMKLSYCNQSQRYVKYAGDPMENVIFNEENHVPTEKEKELITEAFNLYNEMTAIKPGHENKAKFTVDDFVTGIPIEDARYLLPACAKTTNTVTVDGEKMLYFICSLMETPALSPVFKALADAYPELFRLALRQDLKNIGENLSNTMFINNNYLHYGTEISLNDTDPCKLLLHDNEDPLHIAGEAAMCCTSDDIYSLIEDDKYNFNRVAKATNKAGHTGVTEHAKMIFEEEMSLVALTQYARHRHHTIKLENISMYKGNFYTPKTFEKGNDDLTLRIAQYLDKVFNYVMFECPNQDDKMQFSPMGRTFRFMTNTNIVTENHIGTLRICNRAQGEIHDATVLRFRLLSKLLGDDKSILDDAKPHCLKDGCREGRSCCGDNSNVKLIFEK